MALEPCRECGGEISTDAVFCPNCAARYPTATKKRRDARIFWIGCGILVLMLLGFCAYVRADIAG